MPHQSEQWPPRQEDFSLWRLPDASHPALNFVLVWDPEYGMLGIPGGDLCETKLADSDSPFPREAIDFEQSSFNTSLPDTPSSISRSASAVGFYGDITRHDFVDPRSVSETESRDRMTQTSSTMGGLDVYSRGSLMWKAHSKRKRYSFLGKLDLDFEFDPETEFSKNWRAINRERVDSDEPIRKRCGEPQLIEDGDMQADKWSMLEAPQTPNFGDLSFVSRRSEEGRWFKKRRPPDPPLEVLRRNGHDSIPQVDDGWVYVEKGNWGEPGTI